ncbi:MAG: hypothetical protein ACKO23_21400, partial [Gemmataceae bacterium]
KGNNDLQDSKEKSGKAKGENAGTPGKEQGDAPDGDPKKATPEDVKKLAENLRNGSKESQEKAAEKLREISRKSANEEARKLAEESLKEANNERGQGTGKSQDDGSRPNPGGKPIDKGDMGAEQKAEAKANQQDKIGEKSKSSEGNPTAKEGNDQEKPGNQSKSSGKNQPPEEGKGNNSGEGSRGGRVGEAGESREEAQPSRPEKPKSHRASDLQLDEFRKKVDKSVLKDAKMSPEEFQKFLKEYQELVRKQKSGELDKDSPPNPGRVSDLPSMARKKTNSEGKATSDEVRGEGQAKPPPEYRDSHKEFLRRLLAPSR